MGTARNPDQESKGAPVALMTPETETPNSIETPETPATDRRTTETSPAQALPLGRYLRHSLPRVAPWIAATSFVILFGTLLLMFADARRIDTSAAALPTPRPSPTATLAPTPTPQPIDGFQYYIDRTNSFTMQYPVGWSYTSDSQGPQFYDDINSPGYTVQVGVPSNLISVGGGNANTDASNWVDYTFSSMSSKLDSSVALSRLPGPQQSVKIGGVDWQTGIAIISDTKNTVRIRVQVYATIYHDKPYVIALSTSDDRFTAGTIQFFGPMLESFQFTPPAR